ncbi:D-erythronate dehydrogenase [Nereida sp. NH-UV-3]|uniref:D-erythronate dehydrogenase n=1 Tax=Nereida TaxID=282198 RepID=UPI0036F38BD3
MKVLILGAAGMLGRKLALHLQRVGRIQGHDISELVLADVIAPSQDGARCVEVNITDAVQVGALINERPDVIFHLAAIVSGEAEANFDKGYAINLGGTQNVLEAIRGQQAYCPRVVFASSLAIYGAPLPDVILDDTATLPLSSYGAQKSLGEMLVNDYTRKGFIDGVSLRLPTICIRPGAPNKAASGFYSSILREPLAGQEAILPVAESLRHWFASPRAAVGFLAHGAEIDTAALGPRRALCLPGVSASVGEMLDALERVAGPKARALVRFEADAAVDAIVSTWPKAFDPQRALAHGFVAEASFDQIIQTHIEDELGGVLPSL